MQPNLIFTHHALMRLSERSITKQNIETVAKYGKCYYQCDTRILYLSPLRAFQLGANNSHILNCAGLAVITNSRGIVVTTYFTNDDKVHRRWENNCMKSKLNFPNHMTFQSM